MNPGPLPGVSCDRSETCASSFVRTLSEKSVGVGARARTMAVTRHVGNLSAMNTQIVEQTVRQPVELATQVFHLPARANRAKELVHGDIPDDTHESCTARDSRAQLDAQTPMRPTA